MVAFGGGFVWLINLLYRRYAKRRPFAFSIREASHRPPRVSSLPLHSPRHGQSPHPGHHAPRPRSGVLGVGGGGHRNVGGHRGKGPRGLVVGVLHPLGPDHAVEGHRQIRQNGIEGVGDHGVIGGHHGGVTEVLDHEGVGQPIPLGNGGGAQGLGDGQKRLGGGGHRLGGGDGRGDPRPRDRGGIGDRAPRGGRGEVVDAGLIDQKRVAVCGHRDPRDRQRIGTADDGSPLSSPVQVVGERPLHVVQRHSLGPALGVSPQIIGDGEIGEGGGAAVDQTDDVGQNLPRVVGVGDRILGDRNRLLQLSRHHVGYGHVVAVGQRGLILKGCHENSSCL